MPAPWLATKINFVLLGALALVWLALSGCAPQADRYGLIMPPSEYTRPFPGVVAVYPLPPRGDSRVLSISVHHWSRCAIWLPRRDDPAVDPATRAKLAVIENANCNGASDVNWRKS